MKKPRKLSHIERLELIEELEARYKKSTSLSGRLLYHRKRLTWIFIVGGARAFKRGIDVTGSLLLLILTAPLLVIIAVLIKLSSVGPVLYISQRVGLWGEEFTFLKFRTMRINADQKWVELAKNAPRFKLERDPRVTWIGRILRKSSLDELPQLWCVLKGEMSLVGPRPPLTEEVANYTVNERRRLDIKPGITCIWQVSGRSELTFGEQVKLDLEYIESQSFWGDIKLLLRTIPAVLFGRGAY